MKKLTLSLRAIVDLIIEQEVSSKAYYEAKLTKPIWPGGVSGITIGLGYDVGTQSPAQIEKDWKGILTTNQIDALKTYSGKLGIACKKLLPINILVSWDQAVKCFYRSSLISHAKIAAGVYPELETLHPYEQTAIIGLVYNRGGSLKGDRRTEMLQLVQAIKDDNDAKMAGIIRQMKRLWNNTQRGLLLRRELEAWYIEQIDTPIPEEDKLIITI